MSSAEATPCSSMRIASRPSTTPRRLEAKPGESLTTIGSLPSCRAKVTARSTAVWTPRSCVTTSTGVSTGPGLKKCMPIPRAGSPTAVAILPTDRDEVLVARRASPGAARSTAAKSCRFTSRSSTTASITTSASDSAETRSGSVRRRLRTVVASSAVSLPRFTPPARRPSILPHARSSAPGLLSVRVTGQPASAAAYAMPCPMVPAPTTVTRGGFTPRARLPPPPPSVDGAAGDVRIIAAEPVHLEGDEVAHVQLVVHGPREDSVPPCVDRVHERGVDHLVLFPQHRGPRVLERLEGSDRIGGEQDPTRQGRPRHSQATHDPVIEAVHRAASLVGALVECGEETAGEFRGQRLDFHEYLELRINRVQRLCQRRHGFAVGQAERLQLRGGRPGDGRSVDRFVVVDDEGPVERRVHVQLHGVGPPPGRGAEGGARVLVLVARRAAVGDDERLHERSESAFLASIQLGSFSMSCTSWISSGRGSTVAR